MGVFFYTVFLAFFNIGVRVTALFSPKAKKWVAGRRGVFERLEKAVTGKGPVIWMHCASLGEFEQGRPLLEKLREEYPAYRFLLTFFSPSGYEVRKDYKGADWVFYLPMDGPRNARKFLEIVRPSLVIFVKYEFWYYYLKKIKYRNIPLLLVSALFWENMSFFKWYGALQRKMLSRFDHLFVQDENSRRLIAEIGLGDITSISGDTRFDRVASIASKAETLPAIEVFLGANGQAMIAGSTWPEDEAVLREWINAQSDQNVKLIIAPHEVSGRHLDELRKLFPEAINYSQLITDLRLPGAGETVPANENSDNRFTNVLIIDNIGLLSRLYRYGYFNYIGGGFGKGIHNTLEAAVYGKPLFFGPVFHKFKEAKDLIAASAAVTVHDARELIDAANDLRNNSAKYESAAIAAALYVEKNRGATHQIISYIQEKRLLTN